MKKEKGKRKRDCQMGLKLLPNNVKNKNDNVYSGR
jgi:hypothetical protein